MTWDFDRDTRALSALFKWWGLTGAEKKYFWAQYSRHKKNNGEDEPNTEEKRKKGFLLMNEFLLWEEWMNEWMKKVKYVHTCISHIYDKFLV